MQPPDKTEPVLADKEVVMSALNMKSMSFDGADIVKLRDDIAIMVFPRQTSPEILIFYGGLRARMTLSPTW